MASTGTEPPHGTESPAVDAVTRLAQLAWAIGSPPLLTTALHPHAALTAADAAHWWQQWQPTAPPPASDRIRLGSDFEQLWQYWLSEHPRWQLLAHNLPIREANRTLGEFDLLVCDRETGEQEHWELAVKFYLGYGDLNQPHSWHGPQFRDRLDHKLQHLRGEQLCWKDRPAGQLILRAAGLAPSRARAIVKGRLCYPLGQQNGSAQFAAPGHERGYWATAAQWREWLMQQSLPVAARPLHRTEWLAAAADTELHPLSHWLTSAPAPGMRPLALRLKVGATIWPMVFIVANDWPERAQQAQLAGAAR